VQLVGASESDLVPFTKVPKNLDQVSGRGSGLDIHPFGPIMPNANHERSLQVTPHGRGRNEKGWVRAVQRPSNFAEGTGTEFSPRISDIQLPFSGPTNSSAS
jgi:hypothetical protein